MDRASGTGEDVYWEAHRSSRCYDHSASFKRMGRPTSGWCFSRLVVGVFGLRIALALAWNTTEGQKHLFALYRLDRLDSAVILGVIIYG
jgi:hypothetical protein